LQIKLKTAPGANSIIHVKILIPIGIKVTEGGLKTPFAITVVKKAILSLNAVIYCQIVAIIIAIIIIITIISATILTTIVEEVELLASLIHEEDK
jgi:hypothetical protein